MSFPKTNRSHAVSVEPPLPAQERSREFREREEQPFAQGSPTTMTAPTVRTAQRDLAFLSQSEDVHLIEEDEFLPSLSPWMTISGMGLVILFSITLLLASILKFSDTVKAPAVVRPVGELKVAQSSVEGVIEQIYVQENQPIRKGDLVARLDDSRLRSKINQLYADMQRATMQLLQINSQLKGIDNQVLAERNMMARTVAAAKASVVEQQNNYKNLRTSAMADYEEAFAGLSLALQEMKSYQKLAASGAVPKLLVRQKESAVEAASARVRKLRALRNPTSAPIVRAQEFVIQEQARGAASLAGLSQQRDQFSQNQIEAQKQVERSQLEIKQAEKELKGTVIRATADGTILQLNLRNPGQFVQPGQAIAQIAPPNYALLVKAQVQASDINKVLKGSEVQMRVNGCPYSEYGTLKGIVKNISADIVAAVPNSYVSDESPTPRASTYEVTIEPQSMFVGQGNNLCRLKFGMDGRANIITRKETVLRFLLRKMRLLTEI
jgi:HlyD family secretion protein